MGAAASARPQKEESDESNNPNPKRRRRAASFKALFKLNRRRQSKQTIEDSREEIIRIDEIARPDSGDVIADGLPEVPNKNRGSSEIHHTPPSTPPIGLSVRNRSTSVRSDNDHFNDHFLGDNIDCPRSTSPRIDSPQSTSPRLSSVAEKSSNKKNSTSLQEKVLRAAALCSPRSVLKKRLSSKTIDNTTNSVETTGGKCQKKSIPSPQNTKNTKNTKNTQNEATSSKAKRFGFFGSPPRVPSMRKRMSRRGRGRGRKIDLTRKQNERGNPHNKPLKPKKQSLRHTSNQKQINSKTQQTRQKGSDQSPNSTEMKNTSEDLNKSKNPNVSNVKLSVPYALDSGFRPFYTPTGSTPRNADFQLSTAILKSSNSKDQSNVLRTAIQAMHATSSYNTNGVDDVINTDIKQDMRHEILARREEKRRSDEAREIEDLKRLRDQYFEERLRLKTHIESHINQTDTADKDKSHKSNTSDSGTIPKILVAEWVQRNQQSLQDCARLRTLRKERLQRAESRSSQWMKNSFKAGFWDHGDKKSRPESVYSTNSLASTSSLRAALGLEPRKPSLRGLDQKTVAAYGQSYFIRGKNIRNKRGGRGLTRNRRGRGRGSKRTSRTNIRNSKIQSGRGARRRSKIRLSSLTVALDPNVSNCPQIEKISPQIRSTKRNKSSKLESENETQETISNSDITSAKAVAAAAAAANNLDKNRKTSNVVEIEEAAVSPSAVTLASPFDEYESDENEMTMGDECVAEDYDIEVDYIVEDDQVDVLSNKNELDNLENVQNKVLEEAPDAMGDDDVTQEEANLVSAEKLSQQWFEVTCLLRHDFSTRNSYHEGIRLVSDAEDILNKIETAATAHGINIGKAYQALLSSNTDTTDIKGITRNADHYTAYSDGVNHLGLNNEDWNELVVGASQLASLVRIKLEDANDLVSARMALQFASTFFVTVALHSKARQIDPFDMAKTLDS